jgi:hypothetical protein
MNEKGGGLGLKLRHRRVEAASPMLDPSCLCMLHLCVCLQVEVVGIKEQGDGGVRVSLRDSEGREWSENTQLLVGAGT